MPKVYEAQARAIDALFDVTPGESGSMLSALKGYGGSGHAAREAAGGRLGDDGPGDDGRGLGSAHSSSHDDLYDLRGVGGRVVRSDRKASCEKNE